MSHRIAVTLVLASSLAFAGKPSPTAKEFFALMEKSPRTYKLEQQKEVLVHWTQQNAMLAWPETRRALEIPVMVNGRLDGWNHEPGADALMQPVEELFEANQFAEAEAGYKKVIEKFPRDYTALLGYGDTALMSGRAAEAIPRYEAAIRVCPLDHRGWYFKGNALLALGKKEEAVEMYVRALALRPHHTPLLIGLENRARKLGLKVRDDLVLPKARVEQSGEAIVLTTALSPPWIAWAVCKAVWLGEPSFRKEFTGKDEHVFSVEEERQCLVNAAAAYLSKKKGDPEDEGLARIAEVAQAKLLDGLIAYEIASRQFPNVTDTLTEKERAVVETYVRKFVLVPVDAP